MNMKSFFNPWKRAARPMDRIAIMAKKHRLAGCYYLSGKNIEFTVNFTHPLNYLCLLDESLLLELAGKAKDARIRDIFGYKGSATAMDRDLHSLKICFGHFGGDDEWQRFLERDRDQYSSMLLTNPERGVEFLFNNNTAKKELRPGKPEQVWKYVDWYTIICSLLLQYPNTYADISYILHNPLILPLLKQTLRNPALRERVAVWDRFLCSA